jgi:hypothetical protein
MISIGSRGSFASLSGPRFLASPFRYRLLGRRSDGTSFSFTVSGRSSVAFITRSELFPCQVFMSTAGVAFGDFLRALRLTLFGI